MGTYLSRTPSSTGSRTIATVSFWVKRGNLKASGNNFMLEASSSTSPFNMTRVRFADDLLIIDNTLNGSAANGFYFQSNREYRDPSAWYHIFFSIDVTQANATNGWLLYVNGVQQTKALSYWTQNANLEFSQSSVQMNIGRRHDNTTDNFDGYLAEYHYIDGTRKLYTDFGQTDSTTGIWKPKTYSGSYGTNGFKLEFKNAAALGTDTSGNNNTFTVTNANTSNQVVDTPSNNFATLNPVAGANNNNTTIGQGALQSTTGGDNSQYFASMGVTKGKWCWEVKINSGDMAIGIFNKIPQVAIAMGDNDYSVMAQIYYSAGGSSGSVNRYQYNSTNYYNIPAGFGNDDSGTIYQFLLDLDSGTKTWIVRRAGDASTQGSFTLPSGFLNGDFIIPGYSVTSSWPATQQQWNFGNPPHSIASGNSDANGYGNFEYAVPSGYYSLNTKNLAEYG